MELKLQGGDKMAEIKFKFTDKQSLEELRPMCGFCHNEIVNLPQITSSGITLYCCSNCGSVLGVTK